jgi:hypothetical protein
MNKQQKRITIIFSVIIILLLIPFIAMQFTKEVNWSLFDFIAAALLLLGSALLFELVMRKVKVKKHRIILLVAILFVLLLVWGELAIGIFGSPFAGN